MTKPVSPYELFDIYDKSRFEAQIKVLNQELRAYQGKPIRHGENIYITVPMNDLTEREHQLVCREFEQGGWMTVSTEIPKDHPDQIVYNFRR